MWISLRFRFRRLSYANWIESAYTQHYLVFFFIEWLNIAFLFEMEKLYFHCLDRLALTPKIGYAWRLWVTGQNKTPPLSLDRSGLSLFFQNFKSAGLYTYTDRDNPWLAHTDVEELFNTKYWSRKPSAYSIRQRRQTYTDIRQHSFWPRAHPLVYKAGQRSSGSF